MSSVPSAEALRALAPSIGFPLTICVVSYGPNYRLSDRFLASLYASAEPSLFRLRAGLNEVQPETRQLFAEYAAKYRNIRIADSPANLFKSGMMRRLFHDKPISSDWTIWCDDDTHFTRPDWLQRLALKIEASPNTDQWGWRHVHFTNDDSVLDWIRRAAWYRGRSFLRGVDPDGTPATEIRFATGAFWAIRTKVLYDLDWPDLRLFHAAEDIVMGEALRQNGFTIENFRHGVAINDAPRRNPSAPEVSSFFHALSR